MHHNIHRNIQPRHKRKHPEFIYIGSAVITLFVIAIFAFFYVVYVKGRINHTKRKTRKKKYTATSYDAQLIQQVEDSQDVSEKLVVLTGLQNENDRRLNYINQRYGKVLHQFDQEEEMVELLDRQLRNTRREIAASDDAVALRRVLDERGAEIYGSAWNTSVGGEQTLSQLVYPNYDEIDEYEWKIKSNKPQVPSGTHKVVPKLALNKLK